MGLASKLIVLSLVAVLAVNCLAAQVPAPAAAPQSSCHEHGDGTPRPANAKYQCCLTGHDVAIPQVSILIEPTMQVSAVSLPAAPLPATEFFNVVRVLSEDPPGATPLRI